MRSADAAAEADAEAERVAAAEAAAAAEAVANAARARAHLAAIAELAQQSTQRTAQRACGAEEPPRFPPLSASPVSLQHRLDELMSALAEPPPPAPRFGADAPNESGRGAEPQDERVG
jgi:membrane protein involved in colicin uptake